MVPSTAIGNVNGVMHDADGRKCKGAADLLVACNKIDSMAPLSIHHLCLETVTPFSGGIFDCQCIYAESGPYFRC